jgi:hypothetical protein
LSLIAGVDYRIFWVQFPPDNGTDGGCVILNDDGTYTILMDKRLLCNSRKAKKTYRHEINHILNDDFYNGKSIKDIENI